MRLSLDPQQRGTRTCHGLGGVLVRLLLVGTLAGTLLGCRHSRESSSEHPVDAGSGRAIAESVARSSGCAGFEDFDLDAKAHWDFSCQIGDAMFLIRTVSSQAERAAQIAELKSANKPFEAGERYLVWEFDSPGQSAKGAHLTPFRNALR